MIILLLLIGLVLSFLLSGMESAVLSVSRVRVRHAANEGDGRAARLLPLLNEREALLGAVTVANHIANVSAFGLIIWRLVQALGPWGYAVGFLLALPVFIVGLEVLPKTLFRRYPYRALRRLLPLLFFIASFRSLFKALRRLPAPPPPLSTDDPASERQDLRNLFTSLSAQGLVPASAARLMVRVLEYRRRTTASVMVPLNKIVAVNPDMPATTALQVARQHGFIALPVLGESGKFNGIILSTALPAVLPADHMVRQYMRPVDEVDGGTLALAVLQRLRRRNRSLALVMDGSRKAIGLVTEEDLIAPLLNLKAGR